MRIAEDEIFGPVLSIMREDTLDAALATMNRSRYGNMAVIFTSSGYDAHRFKTHAQAGMAERHAGDLPSLKSDASGNAKLHAEVDIISVAPGPASIVGRGLIVHAQPDDYKTQPTGNAGARSACAVIQRAS